ncbi:hypothetical protein BXZ70DRAFT_566096 [Cristinia sonorae]|uniref:Zn(2)-C6 fungal-type domain-containing protein n=1 Tax=Cristinia sonorae TaxID=1940300 RepID=A0A8K0XKT8_9AGAR|nr:hypothetical protein BXZ70DRAFT_566096 [Cristinia sonorae]
MFRLVRERKPHHSRLMPSDDVRLDSAIDGADAQSHGGGKVKHTRRRQRLSCVECTKRRQKCDRQIPCSLCSSRGIAHLCRWEPIVVRPPPQRPPDQTRATAGQAQGPSHTVESLLARVAELEEALRSRNAQDQHDVSERLDDDTVTLANRSTSGGHFEGSKPDSSTPSLQNDADAAGPVEDDIQVAVTALAQLSLAPGTEYVGAGTLACTFNGLGDSICSKIRYPRSTMMRARVKDNDNRPISSLIRNLLSQLPPRCEVEAIINCFFLTRNAEFGISDIWFRTAMNTMWFHMDNICIPGCSSDGDCPACEEEVNPHWLSLFFSVLAVTAASIGSQPADTYFRNALSARKLVEDILLINPNPKTDASLAGTILSCLATVMMAAYLADRGRISEAWRLIGGSVRCGISVGLHRDIRWTRWEKMGGIEKELRTLTWWLLVAADRQYSYILGRPMMTQTGTFEASLLPGPQHGDGSPNKHALFRKYMTSLSTLICEATVKCVSWEHPTYPTICELYKQYQRWEEGLPARFKWHSTSTSQNIDDDAPPTPARLLAYQKVLLASWWLDTIMGIHRIFLMINPPTTDSEKSAVRNLARERSIEFGIQLVRVLVEFHEDMSTWPAHERALPTFSQYFLFDGAVALTGALSQNPPHPQSAECLDLMKKAMRALAAMAQQSIILGEGQHGIAHKGIVILNALFKAGGWEMSEQERGNLVCLNDFIRYPPSGNTQNLPPTYLHNPDLRLLATPQFQSQPLYLPPHHTNTLHQPQVPPSLSSPSHRAMALPSSTAWGNPALLPTATYTSPFPYLPPEFDNSGIAPVPSVMGNMDGGFGFGLGDLPPQPGMVMPHNVLQDVGMLDEVEFDLDWARLAGMDHWYSGQLSLTEGTVS